MSSKNTTLPRSFVLLVVPMLCLLPALLPPRVTAQASQPAEKPAAKPPEPPATSPKEEYQALIAKMKKSDPSVDFSRLRWLRTQLDNYAPYGADPEDHPYEYLATGNAAAAQVMAENILAANELDLESNVTAGTIAEQRKDTATAAYHRYVVQGILDSVLRSGDGNSPETAYKVIAISEEYAVLSHLGLQPGMQALLDVKGKSYDLFKGLDAEGQFAREVYFDIDPIQKGLDKKFSE